MKDAFDDDEDTGIMRNGGWKLEAIIAVVLVVALAIVSAIMSARISDNEARLLRTWDRFVMVERIVQENRETALGLTQSVDGRLQLMGERINQVNAQLQGINEKMKELRDYEIRKKPQ